MANESRPTTAHKRWYVQFFYFDIARQKDEHGNKIWVHRERTLNSVPLPGFTPSSSPTLPRTVAPPTRALGYRLLWRWEAGVEGDTLKSNLHQEPTRYFLRAKTFFLSQVRQKWPNEEMAAKSVIGKSTVHSRVYRIQGSIYGAVLDDDKID